MAGVCSFSCSLRSAVGPLAYFSAGLVFATVKFRIGGDSRTCTVPAEWTGHSSKSSGAGLLLRHLVADDAEFNANSFEDGSAVNGKILLQVTADKKVFSKPVDVNLPPSLPRFAIAVSPSRDANTPSRFSELSSMALMARKRNISEEVDMKQVPQKWAEEAADTNSAGQVGPISAAFCGGIVVGVALTMLMISIVGDFKLKATDEHLADAHLRRQRLGSWDTSEDHESLHLFWPRCGCLVLLMLIQSLSSFIIDGFGGLFQANPSLVHFLTMVVGTGGNVGAQSVVLAVRRLALGERVSITRETLVGLQLSSILVSLAFIRCLFQGVELSANIVICTSILTIIVGSACLGTAIPKSLYFVKIDPAHATPTIQVLMDILGVFVVCMIGRLILTYGTH